MASSSSSGSLVPYEILESILRRVPAESLKRFKSTCKRWYALFKDKRFIYNHLDLVQEHFIRVTNTVQTINPATNACSSLQLPYEFRGHRYLSDMIHCDGLLLCIFNDPHELAVWNPCFNQVKWIVKSMGSYSFNDYYGIGYNRIVSRDNYKILRFYYEPIESTPTGEYDPTVEIYDFKSKSWRTLNVALDWSVCYSCNGVSVKGNMYWVGETHHSNEAFIQSFDFSIEKFKRLGPIPFDRGIYDTIVFSGYREDKLSLLHQRVHEELDQVGDIAVWVTSSVVEGRNVSWTKLFSVWTPDLPVLHPRDYPPYPVYFIDQSNRINVLCSQELVNNGTSCVCVNLYIIGKDGFKRKEIERHSLYQSTEKLGYKYLPSLVPVPK